MKCDDCILGVKNGAVCEKCAGTTFVKEKIVEPVLSDKKKKK